MATEEADIGADGSPAAPMDGDHGSGVTSSNHGCLHALDESMRRSGSLTISLAMKSFARGEISAHSGASKL